MKNRNQISDNINKKEINQRGFGLIEILITATIIAISFIGFTTFILFSRDQTLKSQRKTQAISYAEEAIEVVRKLRDDSYGTNIAGKTGTHYIELSGTPTSWSLTNINPGPSNGFTTSLVFSNVSRDPTSFNIVTSGGSPDADTKKVDVTVSWSDSGTKSVSLSTYITNFRNN